VLIARLPKGESLWRRGSHCVTCGAAIAPYDNLPVASFLLLRGRCRVCGGRFSARYMYVEAVTALVFAASCAWHFGPVCAHMARGVYPSWAMLRQALWPWLSDCTLFSALLSLTLIDAAHFIIPLEITATGFLAGFAYTVLYPEGRGAAGTLEAMASAGIAMVAGGGLFMLVRVVGAWWFKREALGLGDVHLMLMLALYLNWPEILLVIMVSALFGSVGGILTKHIQRRAQWRFEIPYGPYIAAAALFVRLWGGSIIAWYQQACF
jgi:leader peptidase (prepilin peptidase)/N-methyltransferase